MENKNELIKSINWQVWYYNSGHTEERNDTDLIQNTAFAAEMIKANAKIILDNLKKKSIVKRCIEQIETYSYGSIIPDTLLNKYEGFTRLREMPEFVANTLIEYCDKLINLCKSDEDIDLKKLNDKYAHKYLYFEGYESGSVIAYIEKISYNCDELVWSGGRIDLNSENSSCGIGVNFTNVEEEAFENLPYFENAYDFEDYYAVGSIGYLDKWLSFNKYGYNANGNKNSRELTPEQVKQCFCKQISWGFEMLSDFGVSWENIYEETDD